MEIIGYLLTGILEIVLCIVISELLDRKLSKKGAEFDSFKRTSSELDSKTEDRLPYSMKRKIRRNKPLSMRYLVVFIILFSRQTY